ncbi:MAG: TatD family hydrolase, partial [Candidatus Aenigmatarchaeota archaeon]
VPENAIEDILPYLKGMKLVMHFFSGNAEQSERIAAMGGYISLTHIRSKEKRKIINNVPLDRLLVESDAPFIGRTPESIREAIAYIAEVKGLDAESVGRRTAQNAGEFFGFRM